jgi:hypothetical protein
MGLSNLLLALSFLPAATNFQFSDLDRNKRYLTSNVFTQFNLSAAPAPGNNKQAPCDCDTIPMGYHCFTTYRSSLS